MMNNTFLVKPNEKIIYEIKTRGKLVIHLTNGNYVTFTKEEVGSTLKIKDAVWGGNLLEPYLTKIRNALGIQNPNYSHISKILDRGNFITGIDDCGCCQLSNLLQIFLPSFNGWIPTFCFYDNSKLTSVHLPLAKWLGWGAFHNCTSLKSIKLNGITNISWSYQAFENCTLLENVEFSNAENMEGNLFHMFYNCPNLKVLTFPKVLQYDTKGIGYFEIFDNPGIEKIYFPRIEKINNPLFFNNMEKCKYVQFGKMTMEYAKLNNEWGLLPGCLIQCIDGTYIKE